MSKVIAVIGVVAVALTLVVSVSAASKVGTLTATVGPGFNISMSKKSVKAGTYTITVKDKSNIHNFHLKGKGVNKLTTVKAVGTFKWRVVLKKGTYTFVCDPHATIMKGTLKVT